jgi:hypothetical protein
MSQDPQDLANAYTDAVHHQPKKRRPVRVRLSTARATQLRNALERVVESTPTAHGEAHAIVVAFTMALTSVLPPQLLQPAGPSK